MFRHQTSPKESNNVDRMRDQVNNFDDAGILRELLCNAETTVTRKVNSTHETTRTEKRSQAFWKLQA